MTKLVELRERIRKLYGKHNRFIIPAARFILAFFMLLLINYYVGYMNALNHVYVAAVLAVLCAVLPLNVTIMVGAAVIIVHLYALSMEVAAAALLLFLMMFFLYFRFSPKNRQCMVITPIAFWCHIPYVMPVANGLIREPSSIVSVIFGTILYYFLNGIHNNAALLGNMPAGETGKNGFVVALDQLLGNREMYLVIFTFALAMAVVYNVRRLVIDHAWSIAIGAGILTEFVVLCVGYLLLGISGRIFWLIVGSVLSTGISLILEFFFFNLDYSRTEKVQFEDDEYYYYVKAVPKVNLSSEEKQIKKISGKKGGRKENEKITKKDLARELDIDEDMLD